MQSIREELVDDVLERALRAVLAKYDPLHVILVTPHRAARVMRPGERGAQFGGLRMTVASGDSCAIESAVVPIPGIAFPAVAQCVYARIAEVDSPALVVVYAAMQCDAAVRQFVARLVSTAGVIEIVVLICRCGLPARKSFSRACQAQGAEVREIAECGGVETMLRLYESVPMWWAQRTCGMVMGEGE